MTPKKLTRREAALVGAAKRAAWLAAINYAESHRLIVRVHGAIVYDRTIAEARAHRLATGHGAECIGDLVGTVVEIP